MFIIRCRNKVPDTVFVSMGMHVCTRVIIHVCVHAIPEELSPTTYTLLRALRVGLGGRTHKDKSDHRLTTHSPSIYTSRFI